MSAVRKSPLTPAETDRRDRFIRAAVAIEGGTAAALAPTAPATEWQSRTARLLGQLHPDGPRGSYDVRRIRRWVAGERPVPGWVDGALRRACHLRISALETVAGELWGGDGGEGRGGERG